MKNYIFEEKLSTCVFSISWGSLFESMDDEKAGQLIKTLFRYMQGIVEVPEDPEMKDAYELIIGQINFTSWKYAKKRRKKARAIAVNSRGGDAQFPRAKASIEKEGDSG